MLTQQVVCSASLVCLNLKRFIASAQILNHFDKATKSRLLHDIFMSSGNLMFVSNPIRIKLKVVDSAPHKMIPVFQMKFCGDKNGVLIR